MDSRNTRNFASVLDSLLGRSPSEVDDDMRPAAPLDYLAVADELHSGRIVISTEQAAAEYDAEQDQESAAPVSEAPPIVPEIEYPDTTADAIARELGLSGGKPPADLDILRRRFAMANHPDCVEPHLRDHAMTRMQIANMLIDEAKRAKGAGAKLR